MCGGGDGVVCDFFVGNWREVCVGNFYGRVDGGVYFWFFLFEVRGDVCGLGFFFCIWVGDDFFGVDIFSVFCVVFVIFELFVCGVLVYVFCWVVVYGVVLVDVVGVFCGGVGVGVCFVCVYFVYGVYDLDVGGCYCCGDDECVLLLYGVFVWVLLVVCVVIVFFFLGEDWVVVWRIIFGGSFDLGFFGGVVLYIGDYVFFFVVLCWFLLCLFVFVCKCYLWFVVVVFCFFVVLVLCFYVGSFLLVV